MNLIALIATALAASSPLAQPAAPAASSERPVLYVSDVTSQGSARHDRLDQAYTDCLIDAGAPTIPADSEPRPVPASNVSAATGLVLDWPAPAAARSACADLEPVYPAVLEAATNPNFAAMAQTYVACLADGGLHVRLLGSEHLDWTYRDGYDVPEGSVATEDDCLLSTFGSD